MFSNRQSRTSFSKRTESSQWFVKLTMAMVAMMALMALSCEAVNISTEALDTFEVLKTNKTLRYIIYKVNNDRDIVVDIVGQRDASYRELREKLNKNISEDKCRFIVFACPQPEGEEGSELKEEVLTLINWQPETARVRQKLIYSSSYDTMKRALPGVKEYFTATYFGEMDRRIAKIG